MIRQEGSLLPQISTVTIELPRADPVLWQKNRNVYCVLSKDFQRLIIFMCCKYYSVSVPFWLSQALPWWFSIEVCISIKWNLPNGVVRVQRSFEVILHLFQMKKCLSLLQDVTEISVKGCVEIREQQKFVAGLFQANIHLMYLGEKRFFTICTVFVESWKENLFWLKNNLN